jgi:hypothetical protein
MSEIDLGAVPSTVRSSTLEPVSIISGNSGEAVASKDKPGTNEPISINQPAPRNLLLI